MSGHEAGGGTPADAGVPFGTSGAGTGGPGVGAPGVGAPGVGAPGVGGPGVGGRRRIGDRAFRTLSMSSGLAIVAVIVAIAVFLTVQAVPALRSNTVSFLGSQDWAPDGSTPKFGVLALVVGTLMSSAIALVLAVPVAIGTALYSVEYAPRRLGNLIGYTTDLLAAIPSVVYGLWGLYFLLPRLVPLQGWLADTLGWIPLFADPTGQANVVSRSIFAAGLILAIMILPIITAITREVLRQVPDSYREASLALGATRWEMVRQAILPPSWSGISGAVMLGMGRALGETIAVALVIGATYRIQWHILLPGGNTIAANIANTFGEAGSVGRGALIASGLVLFVITFAVNFAARTIVYRAGLNERSAL